jgi:hypothetical protein
MAHIAHQPGPVCLEGVVSRWLVGVVGLGGELLQRPHAARGALLQFEWRLVKRAVPRPSGAAPEGHARGFGVARPLLPGGGGQEEKSRCFSQPTSLLKCARRKPWLCT